MLSFILSGIVALAQAAPARNQPHSDSTANLPANLVRDSALARKFANTVSGPQAVLSNWTAPDVCSWNGFYCETNPDTNALSLASIDFNEFGLTGNLKLTGWIEQLTDLAILHLNTNSFSGAIPDFSKLQYLYEIDLSNNKFSGPFPQNIFTLSGDLAFLDLRYNSFTGSIPAEVFSKWAKIEALFLNNNRFSGPIPASVSKFAGNYLSLANNQLSGPLPAGLASATNLKEFVVLGNKLTGSIPQGLGALKQLEVFDVSNNQLMGTVPEDLCAIKTLTTLVVKGNKIDAKLGPKCKEAKAKGILKI